MDTNDQMTKLADPTVGSGNDTFYVDPTTTHVNGGSGSNTAIFNWGSYGWFTFSKDGNGGIVVQDVHATGSWTDLTNVATLQFTDGSYNVGTGVFTSGSFASSSTAASSSTGTTNTTSVTTTTSTTTTTGTTASPPPPASPPPSSGHILTVGAGQ